MSHKQLVLFLVTFCASGSIYVQGLSVNDAKNAINTAMNMLQNADPNVMTDYDSPIILDNTPAKVHCFFKRKKVFNCGIRPRHKFLITENEAKNVETWFMNQDQLAGKDCLPPEKKRYKGRFINCLGKTNNNLILNYHLQIPDSKGILKTIGNAIVKCRSGIANCARSLYDEEELNTALAAMQSNAEIEGWLSSIKDLVTKYGPTILKTGLNLINSHDGEELNRKTI